MKDKIKRIFFEILFITILSYCWNNINKIEKESANAAIFVVLALVGYCFYVLINKFNENIGFIYPFINGYMITTLSFLDFPINIIVSILLILSSIPISFKWSLIQKSEFCEVILLCVEAAIISIIIHTNNLYHLIDTFVVTLFTETGLFFINCLIMCVFKKMFDEDVDEYLLKTKGYMLESEQN